MLAALTNYSRTGGHEKALPVDGSATRNAIVLDLEAPANLKLLGTWLGTPTFAAVVRGLKMRVAVARRVFPHAPLGMYGSPNGPNSFVGEDFNLSAAGYRAAAAAGLFDGVDFLVPVLYFGVNTTAGNPAGHEAMWNFTRTTLDLAVQLRRSSGEAIPVYANTKFTYRSDSSGGWLEPQTTQRLVALIQSYGR